jgi:hypothetical protein
MVAEPVKNVKSEKELFPGFDTLAILKLLVVILNSLIAMLEHNKA